MRTSSSKSSSSYALIEGYVRSQLPASLSEGHASHYCSINVSLMSTGPLSLNVFSRPTYRLTASKYTTVSRSPSSSRGCDRSLSLVDKCPDIGSMANMRRRLRYAKDRLLCGVMDGQVLNTAMLAMPRLRSFMVSFSCHAVHGLSWETLTSILSVPQLENFNIQLFNFSPRPRPAPDLDARSLAPLKSFRYIQPAFRWWPHYFAPERDALADVLGQLHDSLEILHLPSMSAPINALAVEPWPRLRELVLQGQLPEGLRSPFITLLSGMPAITCPTFGRLSLGQQARVLAEVKKTRPRCSAPIGSVRATAIVASRSRAKKTRRSSASPCGCCGERSAHAKLCSGARAALATGHTLR